MKNIFACISILLSIFVFVGCASKDKNNSEGQTEAHVCSFDHKTEFVLADCTTNGYTIRYCACGASFADNEVPAKGHSWDAWEIDVIPTQSKEGIIKRTCKNGHDESLAIPKISSGDYQIIPSSESYGTACLIPTTVHCTYKTPIYDDATQEEINISFYSQYLYEHAFTKGAVHSDIEHFNVCGICSYVDEESAEAHNFDYGACTVCQYFDQKLIYSKEDYGLAVSYSSNACDVVIPEYYMDHYLPKEENKIKGIKSFADNSSMRKITIPASIVRIDDFAFAGCDMLDEVYYDGTWDEWCSISFGKMANPMLYTKAFYIKSGSGYQKASQITVTDAVSVISSHAFEGLSEIAVLRLPKTLTSLGDGAGSVFSDNLIIENVYYEGDISDWCKISICDEFSNPMRYTHSFCMLDADGGYRTPNHIVIPNTLTQIGSYQFFGCSSLLSIKIEGELKQIGEYAFYGCTSLSTVDLSGGCEIISQGVFANCTSLATIYLPSDLMICEQDIFDECRKINAVYFKGSVDEWCGISFLSASSSPMSVNASRTRENAAILYLYSEETSEYFSTHSESLVISGAVSSIGSYQFFGFKNLSELIISDGVTSIGDEAFGLCEKLSTLVIPKSIEKIGKSILVGCNARIYVNFTGTSEDWSKIEISTPNNELNAALIYRKES